MSEVLYVASDAEGDNPETFTNGQGEVTMLSGYLVLRTLVK